MVPLLNTKHLDDLPPRVLRFQLRLAKYDYTAIHVPGKLLYAADVLSPEEEELREEVEAYINQITVPSLPVTEQGLEKYRKAQIDDDEC